MVGVLGFEPRTSSTQNSRATRLRHTPKHRPRRERLSCVAGLGKKYRALPDTLEPAFGPALNRHGEPREKGLSRLEQTVLDLVARLEANLLSDTAVELQHTQHRLA